MTPYQKEQAESLAVVMRYLTALSGAEKTYLRSLIADYLSFLMYLHNSPGLVRVKRLAAEKSKDTGAARL